MTNTTNKLFALALLTLTAVTAGCSGDPGDSSEDNERDAPASSLTSATGTGSSSANNAFLGTWSLGGTQSTTCGAASATTQLNGLVIITSSSAADDTNDNQGATRIDTKYSSTCSMTWDVTANQADVEKSQVCTVTVGDESVTISLTSGTMTMINDTSMTVLLSGAAANGCSFTQQETLTLM